MKRWALPLLWAGLIFVASSIPGSSIPSPGVPYLDKAVHAAVYAVLAYLIARALTTDGGRSLVVAAVIAALYGISDEIHQRWTPGRDADVWDGAVDALGAAAGAWLRGRYSSVQMRAKP